MNLDIMESVTEIDGFEPQTRARSNTWPLPRPENYVEPGDDAGNKCAGLPIPTPNTIPAKKNSSRRNAWGNLSYADLITQAITSSPEKRLTLSQIYEWMVQNVPYFKDKGDSNSSAGWKFVGTLHFLAHGSYQKSAGQDYRNPMSQPSASRAIHKVVHVLVHKMHHLIKFPQNLQKITAIKNSFYAYSGIPGINGCIDCTHVNLSGNFFKLGDLAFPRLTFLNRKNVFSLNVQINSIRHNLSLHNRFMRVQNEGTGKSSWWMINPDAKPGKSVRRRAASMETSKFEKRRGRVKKKVEALRNGLPDAASSPCSSVSEGLDLFPDSPLPSSGFQLSPDFRPRASSNTSSCGRLSPIPAVVGLEPDWSSASAFPNSSYSPEVPGSYSPDQLAGNLEQGMKLQSDAYLEYLNGQTQQQPPSYSTSFEQYPRRDISAFGLPQCPIHRLQGCSCLSVQCKVETMSPPPCTSPSYPQSEPSPDPLSSHQYLLNTRTLLQRPSSSSPPLTPQPHQSTPCTMMGQLMGALNNSALLDDLNINIESLQGGFDCNVDEVIKHELSMDGNLDFNFTGTHQSITSQQDSVVSNTQTSAPPPYSTAPSWVH